MGGRLGCQLGNAASVGVVADAPNADCRTIFALSQPDALLAGGADVADGRRAVRLHPRARSTILAADWDIANHHRFVDWHVEHCTRTFARFIDHCAPTVQPHDGYACHFWVDMGGAGDYLAPRD